MKNLKIFTSVILLIVSIAMITGFFIIYPEVPKSALARLFIDMGALIALFSVCMTLPKFSPPLKTDEITDALRDLARGHYDRRLVFRDFSELSGIAQAFNELAGTLSDNSDPGLVRIRSLRLGKPEPLIQRPTIQEGHSYHPELGQVQRMPSSYDLEELYKTFQKAHQERNLPTVDFESFKTTLNKATEDLLKQHGAKAVRFEVVLESGEIALRPRLTR